MGPHLGKRMKPIIENLEKGHTHFAWRRNDQIISGFVNAPFVKNKP